MRDKTVFRGRIMTRTIATLRAAQGLIFAVVLSALPIVLALALMLARPEPDLKDKVLRTAAFLLFILPGIMFLNMASFFARLRRSNPDVYANAISNGHWFEYLGRSGRSLLSNLHYRVSQIATDRSGQVSRGIRLYATFTRYLNRLILAYIISGAVLALAFGIHQSVGKWH